MKTMWKGAIQLGLVSIPVRMYAATEEKTVRFHQLHAADHGRVRYDRVCEVCGEEVAFEDLVRGHEYAKGHYAVLSDDDLRAVPIPSNRAIEIAQFVDLAEVDPILHQRTYYLAPDEAGRKPYQPLRSVLEQTHNCVRLIEAYVNTAGGQGVEPAHVRRGIGHGQIDRNSSLDSGQWR